MTRQPDSSPAFFQDSKPVSIRIWHWLLVFFFFASLMTVFFGSTLFRTRDNVAMVQEQIRQEGGTISEKQAWRVAHEFSDKLWMLHKYIGFGLAIMLLWRIGIEASLSKEQKLTARLKKALQYPHNDPEANHYKMVQRVYAIFYVFLVLMVFSGLILAFEDVPALRAVHEPAEVVHNVVQYGLYAFLLFHIVGVVRADLGRYGGIISRMINGKN